MRNQFFASIKELADKRNDVYLVAADVSPASAPDFFENHPDKFINTGVAEQSMVGVCAGLALRGKLPFAYTIAPFCTYRPFEQIRDDICYQNLPVTIVGMGAGVVYSTLGATHHTIEDIAVMGALPNMRILAPSDPLETNEAIQIISEWKSPTYLRIGKAGEPNLTENCTEPFSPHNLRTVREGEKTAFLTYGTLLGLVLEISMEFYKKTRTDSAVITCPCLKPLPIAALENLLNSYNEIIVIEEHVKLGSLGSQLKEMAFDLKAETKIIHHHLKDEFIHCYGNHRDMLNAHGISSEKIVSDYKEGDN